MGEVVEGGQKAEGEGDGEVQEEEKEVLSGAAAGFPRVEEVEQHDCEDAEEGAGAAGAGDAVGREVGAEDEAEDAGAEIHYEEAECADDLFDVSAQRELQE